MALTGKKLVIGVTGNIACGKTFLLEKFSAIAKEEKIKFYIINIDLIRRNILTTSKSQKHIRLRKILNKKLGLNLLDKNIKINGQILGTIIFNNKNKMDVYKKIINPEILKIAKEEIKKRKGIIAIEWAMLAEDNFLNLARHVIFVKCNKKVQNKRLIKPDIPLSQLKLRIKSQTPTMKKIKLIKQKLNKNNKFFIFDTSDNPDLPKYKLLFKKIT
jgi:dephospho-CoA kinase